MLGRRKQTFLPRRRGLRSRAGFGIVEVMVSIVVLGFMYVALSKLQGGNHDAFIRIRGRDGAVEVAQRTLDSLKAIGIRAIPSMETKDTVFTIPNDTLEWERGLGGKAAIVYSRTITVAATRDYTVESKSSLETIRHVYAKQVNVKVEWNFKGSTQSINMSGVIQ